MQFFETPDSRSFTSEPPAYVLRYKTAGEPDDSIVQSIALAASQSTASTQAGTLYRQAVQIEPDGYAQYKIVVPYGPRKRETGEYSFSFDTSGGTVNVKAAKKHIKTHQLAVTIDPRDDDPHLGSINVKRDMSVDGVDIVIPALRFTVSFRHPLGVVDLAFVKNLASATGKTNKEPFLGFEAGELLFVGASGSDGSAAEAEIAYSFIASANVTNLTVGPIPGIDKKGHEYSWVEFEDDIAAGTAAVVPERVHVERVYDEVDFAETFGWE